MSNTTGRLKAKIKGTPASPDATFESAPPGIDRARLEIEDADEQGKDETTLG